MSLGLKTLFISCGMASTVLGCCCSAPAAAVEVAAEATTTLKVEGMTCASCSVTVKTALKKLDGVRDAQVSAKEKRARVTYDPARVTPERMVQAVKDAGYDASVEG